MTENPIELEYDLETVVKRDPRIARRGALDSLHAEALLMYQQAQKKKHKNYGRTDILYEIAHMVSLCQLTEAGSRDARELLNSLTTSPWANAMRTECDELTTEHFTDTPGKIMACRINVLRAHIREVELMFCFRRATEPIWIIQKALNFLSSAAYVAMWS